MRESPINDEYDYYGDNGGSDEYYRDNEVESNKDAMTKKAKSKYDKTLGSDRASDTFSFDISR